MNSRNPNAVILSHIGKRTNQEDNFLLAGQYITEAIQPKFQEQGLLICSANPTKTVQIFAVSDGMGGHNGGEVASRVCIETLRELEDKLQNLDNYRQIGDLIQETIRKANHQICKLSRKNPRLSNMGATLILLVRFYNNYLFFNIGDSRAYYFNDENVYQITKDHTEGQRMLDLGLLEKDELKNFPARKSVNRYLGFDKPGIKLEAQEIFVKARKGCIILCSDGISDRVSSEEMAQALRNNPDLISAGKQIIKKAIHGNRADNATILLIKV